MRGRNPMTSFLASFVYYWLFLFVVLVLFFSRSWLVPFLFVSDFCSAWLFLLIRFFFSFALSLRFSFVISSFFHLLVLYSSTLFPPSPFPLLLLFVVPYLNSLSSVFFPPLVLSLFFSFFTVLTTLFVSYFSFTLSNVFSSSSTSLFFSSFTFSFFTTSFSLSTSLFHSLSFLRLVLAFSLPLRTLSSFTSSPSSASSSPRRW